ncbi:MAG: hypothetical protein ACFE9X_02175 [Promethearchaeota archaeon]
MRRRNIISIIIAAIVVGGGSIFFIIGFATAGKIQESFTFYYQGSPLPIEELSLNADIGRLDIKYNTTSTPYIAKVEVSMAISGLFMAGAQYTEFYTPYTEWWQNSSIPTIFDLKIRPGVWFNPVHWFKSYDVLVTITLRTDVVYDVDAHTGTGSINMNIPDNAILNNLTLDSGTGSVALYSKNANLTRGLTIHAGTGSILANFTNNVMGGNVDLDTGTGSIDFNSFNMEYTQDSVWTINTGTGSIDIVINQHSGMGANVSGLVSSGTGSIDVMYKDTSPNVGASFFGSIGTGSFTRINSGGFISISSNPFDSIDYLTTYNYDLDLDTGTGSIEVNGTSI